MWTNKNQTVIAQSSAEIEYRAMAHMTHEIVWVSSFLDDTGFNVQLPMNL